MPSYRKRESGSWSVRWSHTDPVSGHRSQPSQGGFRTRTAARTWYEHHVAGKQIAPNATIALRDYLTAWLDGHSLTISRSSQLVYQRAVESVSDQIGDVRLRDLTRAHVRAWHRQLSDAGYAPRSIRTYHAALAAALNQAVNDGLIHVSPARGVTPPKPDKSVPPHWERHEIQRFLDTTTNDIAALPYRIMVQTGIRPGECRGLTWADLDLDRGILRVRDSKTAAGVRSLAMPAMLSRELRDWRKQQIETRLYLPHWEDHNLVITSPVLPGRPLTASALRKRLHRYCERLGLPTISPHGLRHSWASWMADLGVHPMVVQQALGHTSLAMTLGTYTHVSEGMSRQAARLLEDDLAAPRARRVP